MKLISWNVNGIRAVTKKNFFEDFKQLDADIFCLQETKAQDDQVAETLAPISGYHIYSNSAEKKGYSGTAILSKSEPLSVSRDMGIDDHDTEGRVLCLEYETFYLVNVYVPNSGSELKRLDYRQEWDLAFFNYLKELEKAKPVVVCGDFNVAHRPIDLARPKPNYNKSAGFMQEEIHGMNALHKVGWLIPFAIFTPMLPINTHGGATGPERGKNVGWRIDYFLVSKNFIPQVQKAYMLNEVMGSDHCPVAIEIAG